MSPVPLVRLAGVTALLALGVACPCPPATCPSTLVVGVRVARWEVGTYAVGVVGEGVALACTLRVSVAGEGPDPGDVTCGDAIVADAFLLDTGGTVVPDLVELTAPTGASQPGRVTVTVRHAVDGEEVTLLDVAVAPAWRRRPETQRMCVEDCRAGRVDVDVPAR